MLRLGIPSTADDRQPDCSALNQSRSVFLTVSESHPRRWALGTGHWPVSRLYDWHLLGVFSKVAEGRSAPDRDNCSVRSTGSQGPGRMKLQCPGEIPLKNSPFTAFLPILFARPLSLISLSWDPLPNKLLAFPAVKAAYTRQRVVRGNAGEVGRDQRQG